MTSRKSRFPLKRVERDQSAMGSCLGSHSDLADCTTYPASQRPGLRISSRTAAIPPEEKEQLPVYSTLHETIFQGTLLESDGKPRPRNPWAAIGSLAFLSVLLLAVVGIPLFHTDPLPKRETLTMLYLQPPPAGSNATKLRAPSLPSTYTPTSIATTSGRHNGWCGRGSPWWNSGRSSGWSVQRSAGQRAKRPHRCENARPNAGYENPCRLPGSRGQPDPRRYAAVSAGGWS